MRRWATMIPMALGLVMAACAPAGQGAGGGQAQQNGQAAGPKSLTIALGGEPEYILMANLGGGGGTGTIAQNFRLAVHQQLVSYDDQGHMLPMLATEIPSQDRGTWVVRPDGTMQTTYHLRHDVTWHDGTGLTAKDFVFAWTVARDPELPMFPNISRQIQGIDTPDDYTLVMEWAETNPLGNAIVSDELGPIPMHLLMDTYHTDKQRFQVLSFWKQGFVGVGPFKMDSWEPGSHLVLKAYDGFFGGRAKLDQLTLRFIISEPAVVANLLGGGVDGALDNKAISFAQAMFVKREWERGGQTPLAIVQTTHWRFIGVQFRVPTVRDILDVRVRRGLVTALDRQSLVNTILEGQAPVSDAFLPPDDPRYAWVQSVLARYPYDVRRAQQLLGEGGWSMGPDGSLVGSDGAKVTLPIWTTAGEQSEAELAIIADSWKAAGIAVDQSVIPEPMMRDSKARASFAAFDVTSIPLTTDNTLRRLLGPNCPSEADRWQGGNRGCYQNPGMDQAIGTLFRTIDTGQQQDLYRKVIQAQTEDLPVLPLYFNINVAIFREGVTGVKGDTAPRTSVSWNAAEWDLKS